GQSVRAAARSLGIGHSVVGRLRQRAKLAGVDWAEASQLSEEALKERLYGRGAAAGASRPEPDPVAMHRALMEPGVTLELLHLEYLEAHPDGYRYTAFCDRYRAWKKKRGVTMRQPHKGGEKLFVDFSGVRPSYADRTTGERIQVELFVATLGASNLTFAVAVPTQRVPDFLHANALALEFFGGVPKAIIPDNLKSAVTETDPYEPTVQRAFADFGRHYGTAIVPARPYRPKDKAKVEVAVQVVQRWILARLRKELFFSIGELNRRIRMLLAELDQRPMKKLGGVTRAELFAQLDEPELRALPQDRFVPCAWKSVRVNRDYHVAISDHYYSVPHALVHEVLEARFTERTVELFHRGERVASHARSTTKYGHTTDKAHMPPAHRQWAEGGQGLLEWAVAIGPHTHTLMQRIFERSPIPMQGWRSGRGLRRLAERYDDARIEEAARLALRFGAQSYRPVARILKLGFDQRALEDESADEALIEHEQIRGPEYFN
ncbi:MAG: IS21 family transposase, partial [Acidobacteriota bacterium]